MYRTTGAAGPVRQRTGALPLGLARIVHRRFPRGSYRVDDPFSVRHFTDLTDGYGVTYRPDVAERSGGNSFTTMATELIETMSTPDDPIEIVVVAHATPDIDCRLSAATYLSDALPTTSLVFALSDGGSCTPYTALRVVGDYAWRQGYQSAMVLLMDQATLPYDTGRTLSGDAAIGILLQRECQTGLVLRQVTGVRPEDVATAVADVLSEVAGDEPVAVIAGTGIDPGRDLPEHAEALWCAETGFPCTATWEGLARFFGTASGGRVVLADYEAETGDLGVCVVERPWLADDARDRA
ncbi:hypothetical protein [Actinocrispum sp. NPDC049592]|uniref:hypothetical protein n=1 Tax=Actinocrispum sp. NPDC049592 TaxID=3154835 RepID=UPI00342E5164